MDVNVAVYEIMPVCASHMQHCTMMNALCRHKACCLAGRLVMCKGSTQGCISVPVVDKRLSCKPKLTVGFLECSSKALATA